jgi:transcriptional regulator of arginine metabolism
VETQRQLPKPERQKLVASLVGRRRLGTQQELLEALEEVGCHVTQATISRDIAELGVEKARDELGGWRYVLPASEPRADPRKALASLLHQYGRDAVAAQNIVVVRVEIGSAPAIARSLDRIGHVDVVGTLAGDDTCLVIAANAERASALARDLRSYMG